MYSHLDKVCVSVCGVAGVKLRGQERPSTSSLHRGGRLTRHTLPISFSSPLVPRWLAEMLSAIWHLRGWKFVRVGSNELETSAQLKSLLISPGRWGPMGAHESQDRRGDRTSEGWGDWRMSHWVGCGEQEAPNRTSLLREKDTLSVVKYIIWLKSVMFSAGFLFFSVDVNYCTLDIICGVALDMIVALVMF